MALAVHSSTPAIASAVNVTSIASNSFSPPANSLVMAVAMNASTAAQPASISNTGGLTFSSGFTAATSPDSSETVYFADVGATPPGAMTVTPNWGTTLDLAVAVIVLTGAATAANQGTGAGANSTPKSSPVAGSTNGALLTAAAATSWIFGAMADFNAADTPTAGTGQTTTFNSQSQAARNAGTGSAWWLQGNTAAGNSNLRMYWTAPTGTSTGSTLLAFEVLAPAGGALTIAVSDTTTSSESAAARLSGPVLGVSDSVTHTETVSVGIQTQPNLNISGVSDATSLADQVSFHNPFDPIDAVETVNVQIPAPGLPASTTDTAATSEWVVIAFDPAITWTLEANAADSATHSESVSVVRVLSGLIQISRSDAILTSDAASIYVTGQLGIPDTTHPPLGGTYDPGTSGGTYNPGKGGGTYRERKLGGTVLDPAESGTIE